MRVSGIIKVLIVRRVIRGGAKQHFASVAPPQLSNNVFRFDDTVERRTTVRTSESLRIKICDKAALGNNEGLVSRDSRNPEIVPAAWSMGLRFAPQGQRHCHRRWNFQP